MCSGNWRGVWFQACDWRDDGSLVMSGEVKPISHRKPSDLALGGFSLLQGHAIMIHDLSSNNLPDYAVDIVRSGLGYLCAIFLREY